MNTLRAIICIVLVAVTSAFSPNVVPRTRLSLSMSAKSTETTKPLSTIAGIATAAAASLPAFADLDVPSIPAESSPEPVAEIVESVSTAVAPVVQAAASSGVDEAIVIGYGAGLVACVVFFAVGFSIGYGTLVKP
eukprot:CAMPEP_0172479984 /NCGR_PEP_ID=MMETSP1066-20121228/4836_1 /TAXON_ID=671091 /ORGANISM="Coscinodiscus wailesii, Strain CCMP2513" /LENGTH=134 /DNA_ID=CAMNT_0013240879 /DNA_START=86 /DNA_END=490 /DNA_ORIENTATION=-